MHSRFMIIVVISVVALYSHHVIASPVSIGFASQMDNIRQAVQRDPKQAMDTLRALKAQPSLSSSEGVIADFFECALLVRHGKREAAWNIVNRMQPPDDPTARAIWNKLYPSVVIICSADKPHDQLVERVLRGFGWIEFDLEAIRRAIGVGPDDPLLVEVTRSDRLLSQSFVVQKPEDAKIMVSEGDTTIQITAQNAVRYWHTEVNVRPWRISSANGDTVAKPVKKVRYDPNRRLLTWNFDVEHDATKVLISRTTNPDEAITSRTVTSGSSISIAELNERVGPIIPPHVDPDAETYRAIVYPIDKSGKRIGAAVEIEFGDTEGAE